MAIHLAGKKKKIPVLLFNFCQFIFFIIRHYCILSGTIKVVVVWEQALLFGRVRLTSLVQIGELARRLKLLLFEY